MSTPNLPHVSEFFRWRPGPIGDPVPPWLLPQLSKEVLVELAKVQLDYEKAVNVALGQYIGGVQNVLAKAGR
jgi:hypothetical protein